MGTWFSIDHPERIDTPALLVYKDRIAWNIDTMMGMAKEPGRLVPHVKTHKMREVVEMQLEKGIRRFKCATIAEAEMLALAGAEGVLIAYQVNGPKLERYLALKKQYPGISWSSLVDNIESARALDERGIFNIYIDIDNGMHRTGIAPEKVLKLARAIHGLKNLKLLGLHVYDGHIRDADFEVRKKNVEQAMTPVRALAESLTKEGPLEIIAGGTPTFSVHVLHEDLLYSPGTCVLGDYGYGTQLKEQPFLPAAVLMTRVISRPEPGRITTDLGHKSVAAENPIDKRIFFLNLDDYKVVSQSEEHLVVQVPEGREPAVGTVLYGIPYHVCPSVALHDEARVIEHGKEVAVWPVIARKRRINI
jgi:D-serine deaminase-like pyridoxal phosphate-dependent protein